MTKNRLFCGCLIRHGFLRLVTLVFLVGGQAFLPTRANASIIFTQLDPTYVVQANGNNPLVRSYDIDINSDGKRDVWVGFNGKAGNISSYGDVGFLGYLPNLPLQNDSTVYRLEQGAIIGASTPNEIPDFSFPRGYHVNPLGSSVGNLHVTYDTGKGGFFLNKTGYAGVQVKIDGEIHYGWIKFGNGLQIGDGSEPTLHDQTRIYGWGYETEPGKAIAAGAIPETSIYSLVALGAVGALLRRRCIVS
jgi:hypothetical protein